MEESSKKITYESLWKAIIRPPRDYYTEEDLGPSFFNFNGKSYIRKDFDLVDFKGLILKVSLIEPDSISRPYDIMPYVIYVHANSSSRVEGIHIKNYLLKKNINICAFDFEGSGYSEGEYISLGYHEKYQLKNIVDFLENYPGVGNIGLWGRSMGAATSLLYASMDKRIKAIVVDSPFADFRRVAKEMCMAQVSIPGFLIEGAISIIGKSVYKKNKMKINEIKPIEAVKKCDIPVIFIHAKDDNMVNFQHTLDLYNNYRGISKEIKEASGGHNAKRPTAIMEYCAKFLSKHLKYKEDKIKDEIEEKKYENDMQNNINNFKINIPQYKKKTIYEEYGVPFHHSKKEEKKEKEVIKSHENNKITEKSEIKEDEKLENNNEIKEEKNLESKIEIQMDNINLEMNDNIKEEKNENNKIKYKNNDIKREEDLKYGKNITFYNTNTNFTSFISSHINNNDQSNEKNMNTINNNIINDNNTDINLNLNMPKRKTIYDDLNLRRK